MDWSSEKWVKLYQKTTPSWVVLPWQSRALFPLMLKECDRLGKIGVGKAGIEGLAMVVHLPPEVVKVGLAGLIEDGAVVRDGPVVTVVNFVEAQEARSSNRMRQQTHRERKHLKSLASKVTTRLDQTRLDQTRVLLTQSELPLADSVPVETPPSEPPQLPDPPTPPEPAVDVKAQRARVGEVYRYWEERLGKPHLEKIPPEVWSVLGKCFKSGLTVELAKEAIDGVVVDAERWPERAAQSAIAQIFGSVSRAQNFAERARKGNPKPVIDIEKIRRGNQRAEDQGWENAPKREVTRKAIT